MKTPKQTYVFDVLTSFKYQWFKPVKSVSECLLFFFLFSWSNVAVACKYYIAKELSVALWPGKSTSLNSLQYMLPFLYSYLCNM